MTTHPGASTGARAGVPRSVVTLRPWLRHQRRLGSCGARLESNRTPRSASGAMTARAGDIERRSAKPPGREMTSSR
jgi:hypothetical protein